MKEQKQSPDTEKHRYAGFCADFYFCLHLPMLELNSSVKKVKSVTEYIFDETFETVFQHGTWPDYITDQVKGFEKNRP